MDHGTSLRSTAAALAGTLAKRNYPASRAGLAELANVCNRCHGAFRVATKITPFEEGAGRGEP
jgi:hypothetical protein